MPRFNVHVADPDTGQESVRRIDADDGTAAEEAAQGMGFLVQGAEPYKPPSVSVTRVVMLVLTVYIAASVVTAAAFLIFLNSIFMRIDADIDHAEQDLERVIEESKAELQHIYESVE